MEKNKREKGAIVKSILFILIFFALLQGVSMFLVKDGSPISIVQKSRGIFSEPSNTIDVIYLGDSESYTSISPMEIWQTYGFASYVAGSPGRRTINAYFLLREALKYQKPKYVFLETNMLFRKGKAKLPTLFYQMEKMAALYQPMMLRQNEWKKLDLMKLKPMLRWKDFMKGFIYNDRVKPYKNKGQSDEQTEELPNEENMLYFKKIKQLCDEKNIKMILYTAPTPLNWTKGKHNGIKNMAEKYEIPMIDLNVETSLNMDWSVDTYDGGNHMNYRGARKSTAFMAEYMKTLELEDKRTDPRYKHWVKDSEFYKKEVFDKDEKSIPNS